MRRAILAVVLAGVVLSSAAPASADVIYGRWRHDDVLIGTNGPDLIFGRSGADQIYARGGDDVIVPGSGPDAVYCGRGTDTVLLGRHEKRHADYIAPSCEQVRRRR